jgi:ketosteroid isomerase-like protein
MSTTISLSPVIATYFDADRTDDIDALMECFTQDARVHDEHEDHVGREAIRAWKLAARQKYQYTSTPLSVREEGDVEVVHSRLEGNFPGSPVEVDYSFALGGDKITSLRID